MKKNKQINYGLIFTVIFLIGIIAIVSFAYIGYKANLKEGEDIGYNILDPRDILDISGEGEDGNTIPFNLNVTLDDLDILDADNNGSSFVEDIKNVTITLNAPADKYKYPVTCEYVFKYVPEVDYTSSSDKPNGVVELGVVGENNINESFGPVSIDKADHDPKDIDKDGSITLTKPFSIRSNPNENGYKQVVWNISYRFYNLEIDQKEIVGKEPKGKVIVESLGCYASGVEMTDQLDTLLKIEQPLFGDLLGTQMDFGYFVEHIPGESYSANDGSYRFAGINPNNYICFGNGSEGYNSGEEADCPLKNKYRVIGYVPVTVNGKKEYRVKVIKAEYLTETEFIRKDEINEFDSLYKNAYDIVVRQSPRMETTEEQFAGYKWNSSPNNTWDDSTLFESLNSQEYLNNAFGNTWINKIETVTWNIGGANLDSLNKYEIIRSDSNKQLDAKLGLMYAYDFTYSGPFSILKKLSGFPKDFDFSQMEKEGKAEFNVVLNWLYNTISEWTISSDLSNTNSAVFISNDSTFLSGDVTSTTASVRPVFYLKPDVKLVLNDTATGSREKPLKVDPPKTNLDTLLEVSKLSESTTTLQCPSGIGGLVYHDGTIDVNDDQVPDDAGDNGYRYAGCNPNNYICFGSGSDAYNNGEPGATCDIQNKYRIIGIVPVTLENGEVENRLKVIKAEYLTKDEFPSGNAVGTGSYNNAYAGIKRIESAQSGIPSYKWDDNGSNTWETSTLYKALNSSDYINKAFGDTWKSKIERVTWNVGGASSSSLTAQKMYQEEIGTQGSSVTVKGENSLIGLMYAHDYGFASSSENWWQTLVNYDNTSIKNRENNWLFNGVYEWTISRSSSTTDYALYVISSGYVGNLSGLVTDPNVHVRPVFYLKSDVKIEGGAGLDGSQASPLRVK